MELVAFVVGGVVTLFFGIVCILAYMAFTSGRH